MIPQKSISVVTGKPCPTGGIWESMGNFKTTVTLCKGEPMPKYCGFRIHWMLVTKA